MANGFQSEWFEALRATGVKRVVFDGPTGEIIREVEFFESAPGFPRFDADTLVPPPLSHAAHEDSPPNHVPPAIQRILKKGSVS